MWDWFSHRCSEPDVDIIITLEYTILEDGCSASAGSRRRVLGFHCIHLFFYKMYILSVILSDLGVASAMIGHAAVIDLKRRTGNV